MQYDQQPRRGRRGTMLKPLPANNIDTGLGLNRMAAILQDKHSVFETDQFLPLIELGEELSGRRYGEDFASDRALRILADHSRAMTFLIADGVVPSNEDRGYVLRRVMRRAIQQGRDLELAPGFLTRYAERVQRADGRRLPRAERAAERDRQWLVGRGGGLRAHARAGHGNAARHIEQARAGGALDACRPPRSFRLHDTYGFPYEMTSELLAEEGLSIEGDFEALMEEQRARSRRGPAAPAPRRRRRCARPRRRVRRTRAASDALHRL